ncbi:MAG: PQQ-binding-like beta-propeller repeat protein [Pirellulaceae bacterium]|nr:PQQ-binding-like beta-propeller repeat protein [Pirellulaceae bacterium]
MIRTWLFLIAFSAFWLGWQTLPLAGQQGNWPQFLGPNGNGQAASAKLPFQWSEKENVAWKTPIHGQGWSSPVIWEDQVWLTTAKEDGTEFYALCVDRRNGKMLHDIKVFDENEPRFKHAFNSYASPTPVLEAGRVYLHFGSYGTAAMDSRSGKVLWKRRDLECDHFRGPGSSPILYGDLLIVHYDGADVQYIVAFNKNTGQTVWKKDRDVVYGTNNGDIKKAYCTPSIFRIDGKDQLISPTSKATLALNPSNGEEVWRVTYGEFSATARPQYENGVFFINTGFSKAQLLAVKAGGTGDVTQTNVLWSTKKAIGSKPSQIVVDGLIFSAADKGGVVACIDAATGEHHWTERIGGEFTASPLYVSRKSEVSEKGKGQVYFFDQKGNTTVVSASSDFKRLAVNQLADGCMASAAVSGDGLFVRTKSALYCLLEMSP